MGSEQERLLCLQETEEAVRRLVRPTVLAPLLTLFDLLPSNSFPRIADESDPVIEARSVDWAMLIIATTLLIASIYLNNQIPSPPTDNLLRQVHEMQYQEKREQADILLIFSIISYLIAGINMRGNVLERQILRWWEQNRDSQSS